MLPEVNRGVPHLNKGSAGIRPGKGFSKMTRAGGSIVVFFAAATWIGVAPTLAQDAKTHRTTLQETAVPSTGYRATAMKIVIDEGGEAPWHTHPGPELGYIVSGEATFYSGCYPRNGGPGRRLRDRSTMPSWRQGLCLTAPSGPNRHPRVCRYQERPRTSRPEPRK